MDRQTVLVPRIIKEFYNNVELLADVMHLNNIPFLTSISEHIYYGTANAIDNLTCVKIEDELKNVIRSYVAGKFRITLIIVDIQFKVLKNRNTICVTFNVVSRGEHVPKIERFHKVVKEQCQCYYELLLFENLPRIVVVHLMKTLLFYISSFT